MFLVILLSVVGFVGFVGIIALWICAWKQSGGKVWKD